MRARVDTGKSNLSLGARAILTRKAASEHRAFLKYANDTYVNVEDPGWPENTPVRVVETGAGFAVLEPDADSDVWRETKGADGIKGALARWALKHVARMEKGASDMEGSLYKGVVVQTTSVADGPNSDKRVSKVLYATKDPFIAKNESTASAKVLQLATKELKSDLDPNDVEVIVKAW